jgi:hypothetical protein
MEALRVGMRVKAAIKSRCPELLQKRPGAVQREAGKRGSDATLKGIARLAFSARIERPPLHRGGSASTEAMPAVSHLLPSSLASLSWEDSHVGLRAAVERGPSEGARSGSTGPTWVSFYPSIVRVPRARRAPGHSPLILLMPHVPRAQKIIRPPPLLFREQTTGMDIAHVTPFQSLIRLH